MGALWSVTFEPLSRNGSARILKAYIIHAGDQQEGAALVFAHSLQQAKVIGFQQASVCDGCEYIDVRGRKIQRPGWLIENAAKPAMYDRGLAHVIDHPPTCEVCGMWYDELFDGICEDCSEEREDETMD